MTHIGIPFIFSQVFEEIARATENVTHYWWHRRHSVGILFEYVGPEADQRIWWILFEPSSRAEHIQRLPNGRSAICRMAQAQTNQSTAKAQRHSRMYIVRGSASNEVSVAHRSPAEDDARKSNRIGEFAKCMQISESDSLPRGCSGCRKAERGSAFGNIQTNRC